MNPRHRRAADRFEAALSGDRAPAPAQAELILTASSLARIDLVTPRPEFAASLRERLMAEGVPLATADAPATSPRRRTRQTPGRARERRLVVATSAAMLLGGGTAMAMTAQSALPGDHLYPIKRGVERAESALASGPRAQGETLVTQAKVRLSEVQSLITQGPPDALLATPTLASFTIAADDAGHSLLSAYAADGDPAVLNQLREFTAASLQSLQLIAMQGDPEVVAATAAAARVVTALDAEALTLCGEAGATCAGDPALLLPEMLSASSWIEVPVPESSDPYLGLSEPNVVFEAKPQIVVVEPAPEVSAPQASNRPTLPRPTPQEVPAVEAEPAPETGSSLTPGLQRPRRELKDRIEDLTEIVRDLTGTLAGVPTETNDDSAAEDQDSAER